MEESGTENDWYVTCYLDEINTLNKLLPTSGIPKKEKWKHYHGDEVYTAFGILNSKTIVCTTVRQDQRRLTIMHLREQNSKEDIENIQGAVSIAVPPRSFFSEHVDGINYSQFAYITGTALTVYNWKTKTTVSVTQGQPSYSDCAKNFLYLTKKHFISTIGSDILIWNTEDGTSRPCELSETHQIMCIENVGNGQIATGNMGGTVNIYQIIKNDKVITRPVLLHTLKGKHKDGILCMCLVDRNTLATSGWEKVIGVWDLPSKQLVRKSSQNHEKNIKFLISIGSGHVASCGRDGLVNISDVHVNTGACKVTLKGHIKDALFLGMMDDGTLVSSSLDKTLRGWTIMNSGKMITKMFANLHQLVGSHTLSDIKIV